MSMVSMIFLSSLILFLKYFPLFFDTENDLSDLLLRVFLKFVNLLLIIRKPQVELTIEQLGKNNSDLFRPNNSYGVVARVLNYPFSSGKLMNCIMRKTS